MKKAFISLVFIFLFLSVSLNINRFNQNVSSVSFDSLNFLFQTENMSFKRNIVESNLDFIINETLIRNLKEKNIEPLLIKQAIALKLALFFKKIEKENINFSVKKRIPSPKNISSASKVIVFAFNGLFLAFFIVLKHSEVQGEINTKTLSQKIRLPENYISQVVVFA